MTKQQYLSIALLVCLVLLAGCAGSNGASMDPADGTQTTTAVESPSPTSAATTISESSTPSPNVSRSEARELAKDSEKKRIEAYFANVSGVPRVSTGVYGETTAEIIGTTETAYVVSVTMSYSYEYNCDGQSGAIDGLQTETVYEVTEANTTLQYVEKRIQSVC
ncbi:hypothetical protein [Haloparvum sp. PAK95]|uniref:hypothetical protein n=1 Tax=Haloparvum sp. PAK95 TaxID=3418962 RepID=UPI003D2EE882